WLERLEEALRQGRPEIFNTDQGVQFTAEAFTGRLEAAGVQVSMDGRGRCLDNVFVERLWRTVKYEDIYLYGYEGVRELQRGLQRYFPFYNEERIHQSLDYRTPAAVYRGRWAGPADLVGMAEKREAARGMRVRLRRHGSGVRWGKKIPW